MSSTMGGGTYSGNAPLLGHYPTTNDDVKTCQNTTIKTTTTTRDKWTRKKYKSRGNREPVEIKEEKEKPCNGQNLCMTAFVSWKSRLPFHHGTVTQ